MIPPLIAELKATGTEFFATMDEAKESMAETETEGSSSLSGLAATGGGAFLALGAAAVAVGGISLELGEKYQSATASMAGSAGISVAAAAKIGSAFTSTAFQTTFSAQDMMTSYAGVAGQLGLLNGKALDSKQALDLMKTSSDLAEASGTDLKTTTADLTNTMQAYHLTLSGASDASADLYNAGRLTGVGMDGVSSALDKLGAKLGAAAPPLDETAAVLVDMTQNGITGRAAIADLNTGITNLVQPTTAGAKEIAALGLGTAVAAAQSGDLQGAIDIMSKKFAAMTPAAAQNSAAIIFGTTAWKGMLPVLESGSAGFAKAQDAVTKSTSVQTAAEAQASSLHGELETLESGAEDLGVKLGTILIPYVTRFIGAISSGTAFLISHKDILIAIGAVIGGYLVIAMGAFVVQTLAEAAALAVYVPGMIAAAAATLAASLPILLIVAALAILAVGVYLLVTRYKGAWAEIKNAMADAWGFIQPILSAIASFLQTAIGDTITTVVAIWDAAWPDVESALSAAWGFISPILQVVGEVLKITAEIVLGILVVAFEVGWAVVSSVVQVAWAILKPIFDVLGTILGAVLPPIVHALGAVFSAMWQGAQIDASIAWAILKPIFDTVVSVLSTVIPPALDVLKAAWSTLWSGIQSAVAVAWKIVKPIFDTITSAISAITGGISKVTGALSSIGGGAIGSVTKLLGFATGGVVPGATGAAQLAVVHGGETVLPVDALSNTSPGLPLPTGIGGSGGGGASGGMSGQLQVTSPVQIDGRTLWQQVRIFALQDQALGRIPNTGFK